MSTTRVPLQGLNGHNKRASQLRRPQPIKRTKQEDASPAPAAVQHQHKRAAGAAPPGATVSKRLARDRRGLDEMADAASAAPSELWEIPAFKTSHGRNDTKGRYEDMKKYVKGLQRQMEEQCTQFMSMRTQFVQGAHRASQFGAVVEQLEEELSAKQDEIAEASNTIAEIGEQMAVLESQHEEKMQAAEALHRAEDQARHNEIEALQTALSAAESEKADAEAGLAVLQQQAMALEEQVDSLKDTLRTQGAHLEMTRSELETCQAQMAEQLSRIEYLEDKTRHDEMLRRQLHETIQELKGNIRVFCRFRPALGAEEIAADMYQFPDFCDNQTVQVQTPMQTTVTGKQGTVKKQSFSYDRVFDGTASQEAVFGEISQLVQSVMDGYNVCIFAYGQTGSGKTHTMTGGDSAESRGMIPRAVDKVFDTAAELGQLGWQYTVSASAMEIYNEKIRDLIKPNEGQSYEIKHDPKAQTTSVCNMTEAEVTNPADVHAVLETAMRNRAVGATECNERSSRSHLIVSLTIVGHNEQLGQTCRGVLNLIDLAGSERLAQSKATGDRLKETLSINKSLSCLGDVIMAMANGDKFVPFRNSKLTYLLQYSLSGNSKSLMFVNLAPGKDQLAETVNSLRFAAKVNACQIGTARRVVGQK